MGLVDSSLVVLVAVGGGFVVYFDCECGCVGVRVCA